MARGTNLDQTRRYNRRAVRAALRREDVASRTEIAARTGLSLPAVSSLVDELVQDGWVASRGRRATARGQPPIDFALAERGAFGVGVAFDADHVGVALVDLTGATLATRRVELEPSSVGDAADCVHELCASVLAPLSAAERDRVLGMGVAVPGVVAPSGRIERMVRLPAWEGVDLAGRLSPAAGLPVTVTNDAVAAALGEAAVGPNAGLDTFFYALFALGLGSALMMDGRPHRGLWGFSGRLGHIPVVPNGASCPACGGRGCLALYASVEALQGRLGRTAGPDADHEVSQRFAAGDEVVHRWVDEAADAFARGMLVLENLLDPDALVVDGRIPREVLAALSERAERRYRATRPRRPERRSMALRLGSRGAAAVAYGAATVPIHLATAADLSLVR